LGGGIGGFGGSLTFGIIGPGVLGVLGNGLLGNVVTGAISAGLGNAAQQGTSILIGTQSRFNMPELENSIILGGGLGIFLRPLTAPSQIVTRWGPPVSSTSPWVQIGALNRLNWLLSGVKYPMSQGTQLPLPIPAGKLAYPSGWQWIKGLIGQRILLP